MLVETPVVALLALRLASEAQFFSIGTNDPIQYLLAADRTNERVSSLHQPLHRRVGRQ